MVLLGICGSLCSGKKTLARYLVDNKGFDILYLNPVDSDAPADTSFTCPMALLDYIMQENRWTNNYCILGIQNTHQLTVLRRRPFFLLLSVDCPVLDRFKRYQQESNKHPCILSTPPPESHQDAILDPIHMLSTMTGLQQFLEKDQEYRFAGGSHCLDAVMRSSDIHWVNLGHQVQVEDVAERVDALDIMNKQRCRPSWDTYFIRLAEWASHRSNCMKRRVGAILVKNHQIIATGYNGTPRGVKNCLEGGCERCNQGEAKCGEQLDMCLCLHAEENALLEAGRERIQGGECILYCTTCPCLGCAKKIAQSGVKKVIYLLDYKTDQSTFKLFKEAGVKIEKYEPMRDCEYSTTESIDTSLLEIKTRLQTLTV